MNKEILNEQLSALEARSPEAKIIAPGDLASEETASILISLLQAMYVEHGITKNREKLVNDISEGNVLTWFAKKDGKFIATASLVKQTDGAWELGRAVSLDRGNGIGKKVILEALKFHIENHSGVALTAEVRAAAEFEGISSGQATQKIFFGTVDKILPITPFAIAPLFSHGNPLRNEPFILSASDVKPGKTITERIMETLNGRSLSGKVPRVNIIQTTPFQLAVPDDGGTFTLDVLIQADNFAGCTLFPIEVTDKNMPLIGAISMRPTSVICGVDRLVGKEGKPVILVASLGKNVLLAPTEVNEVLPTKMREDIQQIADKFSATLGHK